MFIMVCIYLLTMLLDQQLDQLLLAPSSRPQPHTPPHIPKEDRLWSSISQPVGRDSFWGVE